MNNQRPTLYLYTQHNLQVFDLAKLDLSFQYTSSNIDGIGVDDPIYNLSIGASRKFFNNQLMVRIAGNDILNTYRFNGVTNYKGYRFNYTTIWDQQSVKLTLKWDFGKFSGDVPKDENISKEELQRALN